MRPIINNLQVQSSYYFLYNMPRTKTMRKVKNRTYKERAEYLSFVNPQNEDVYFAIAQFFGEDEMPPLPTKK